MTVYSGNPKESTKSPELIQYISSSHKQNSIAYLHTNNKQLEMKRE